VLLQAATMSSFGGTQPQEQRPENISGRELMAEVLVAETPLAALSAFASVPALRRPKVHRPMSVVFVPKTKTTTTIPDINIHTTSSRVLRRPDESEFNVQNSKFEQRAKRVASGKDADYGGLHVSSPSPFHVDPEHGEPQESPRRREIPTNADDLYEMERNATMENLDAQQPKLGLKYRNDEDITGPVLCRRNNWRSKIFPVCNHFHESTLDRNFDSGNDGIQQRQQLQEYIIEFRGHGYFRDSWLFQRPKTYGSSGTSRTSTGWSNNRNSSDSFVWKSMRLKDYFDYDYDMMHQIHQEAIIMERLTSSERIVNMYGHCGTSIFAEHMKEDVTPDIVPGHGYMLQKDLDKLETTDVHPMNNLTLVEKLDMALVMAESLADIHGYKGGVIAHGDVHPDQWLRSSTGQIKLKYVESQSSSLSCTAVTDARHLRQFLRLVNSSDLPLYLFQIVAATLTMPKSLTILKRATNTAKYIGALEVLFVVQKSFDVFAPMRQWILIVWETTSTRYLRDCGLFTTFPRMTKSRYRI
jgi:hypothetical protein